MAQIQRNGIEYPITVVFGLASAAAYLIPFSGSLFRFPFPVPFSGSFFRVEILPQMFPPSGERASGEGKAKLTAAQEALQQGN